MPSPASREDTPAVRQPTHAIIPAISGGNSLGPAAPAVRWARSPARTPEAERAPQRTSSPAATHGTRGAKVLCYAILDERCRPTGGCRHRHLNRQEQLGPAAGLAVCQHAGESGFYLL